MVGRQEVGQNKRGRRWRGMSQVATYAAGGGDRPELVDDVARQEVDVIVGQGHLGGG